MVFHWEEKFMRGSLPGSDIVSSGFPFTSKPGHIFHPESVGEVLVAVVLPWEEKFGHSSPPGSDVFPLLFPPLLNLGIAFAQSLQRRCWVLWFCIGRRNLGMAHPLGRVFCPIVCHPF